MITFLYSITKALIDIALPSFHWSLHLYIQTLTDSIAIEFIMWSYSQNTESPLAMSIPISPNTAYCALDHFNDAAFHHSLWEFPAATPTKVTKHSLSYRAVPIGIAAKRMSFISSKNLLGFFLVEKVQDHTPLRHPRWPVLFVPPIPLPIRMEHTFAIQKLTHHRQQAFHPSSLFLYKTSLFVYI
jgi:hypothetical protein